MVNIVVGCYCRWLFSLNSVCTETADLMKNLALDSQTKAHDAAEATKKVLCSSTEIYISWRRSS